MSLKKIIKKVKIVFLLSWKFYTVFFQKSSCFNSSTFNPILCMYPRRVKRIHQDLSFNGCEIADNKWDKRKISRTTRTPCLYQPSSNWCVQWYDDGYSYMLHSTFRLYVFRQNCWCLNVGNRLRYRLQSSYSQSHLHLWGLMKLEAICHHLGAPPPKFCRRGHFSYLTCKWASVPISERKFCHTEPKYFRKLASDHLIRAL